MKTVLAVAAVLGVLCTQAMAQNSGQQAGQEACGNDVFRLCSQDVPDRGRIEACLRRNFRQVSAPCRQYMVNYGRTHRATSGRTSTRKASRHRRHHYRHHRRSRHSQH